jgi:hypothetical protein
LVSSRTLELISDKVLSRFIDILMEIIYSLSLTSRALSFACTFTHSSFARRENEKN